MAGASFVIDAESFERLQEVLRQTQDNAEQTINDVLWENGGQLINDSIMQLLPRSGRTWRGKKKSARDAAPFAQENENLAVTVKTKNAYHYLYFPDDGSNTRRHAGGQEFMFRGAENEQEHIIELCIAKLTENL